jgi:gliding motility-associated-like protein
LKKLLFLLLNCLIMLGQVPAFGQACIKAYDAKTGQEINTFCAGQQVRFKSCNPDSKPDLEYYDFDKSNKVQFPDTVKFYTYSTPGTYTVTQLINTGAKGVHQGERTFTVLPTPQPEFKATGCSQGSVKVTITDQVYHSFQVDFGGGATQTVARGGTATHQFAPGQPLHVRVTGKYNNALCTASDDTTVQELPLPNPPRLAKVQVLLPTTDGRISLSLEQLRPEYYYVIEKQNGAGFAPLDTLKNPATPQTTKVLDQVNATEATCFRVRITDPCGSLQLPVSNTICSLPLSISGGQGISLSWPPYPKPGQLTGYQLFKNGKPYRELPKDQRSFQDEKVSCQQQGCYELIAHLSNGTQSVSNNPCATVTTSTPPVQPYLSSSFTPDNLLRIRLQVPASQLLSQISYQKSVDGGAYRDLGQDTAFFYQDKTFNQTSVSCYQAVYRDSCDQTSPVSNQTCPIILKAVQKENNTILLTWSSYVGFPPGTVQYLVERVDASGAVLSSVAVSGNTYTDAPGAPVQQKVFYRIQGRTAGQPPTYSNTESLTFEARALIPTAFTPNGDNLNDVFEVKGRFIQLTRLTIYDRWGQVIFQSQGQGWDGRINGKQAPTGTYPYLVNWKDENGLTWKKNGVVSLLR